MKIDRNSRGNAEKDNLIISNISTGTVAGYLAIDQAPGELAISHTTDRETSSSSVLQRTPCVTCSERTKSSGK